MARFFVFALISVLISLGSARNHQNHRNRYNVDDTEEIIRSLRQLDSDNAEKFLNSEETFADEKTIIDENLPKVDAETEELKEELKEEIKEVKELESVLKEDITALEGLLSEESFKSKFGYEIENKVEEVEECKYMCPKYWFLLACVIGMIGIALCVCKKCFC